MLVNPECQDLHTHPKYNHIRVDAAEAYVSLVWHKRKTETISKHFVIQQALEGVAPKPV